MKVLYLGHYREKSGWATAAINNILALDSVGIDVVYRDISLPGFIGQDSKKNIRVRKTKYSGCNSLYSTSSTSSS